MGWKKVKKFLKYIFIVLLILIVAGFIFPTWTPNIKGDGAVSVLEQVEINGTKHGIMIRGWDRANPILIFVHGGPGNSEIPYVTKYQSELEKHFTIVHYDQRGSGKSFHFFENYQELSSEILVDDLLALTDYISERFSRDKVILIGHSYGTYIAMQAAYEAPEKYVAYIGIGQKADDVESEVDILNYCIKQAGDARNTKDVNALKKLTDKIKQGDIITPRTYVRKYGGASRQISEASDNIEGFLLHPEYNFLDAVRYYYGAYRSQKALLSESTKNPLPKIVPSLECPCYFVMGRYDYMTSAKAAKTYFDEIGADKKEYILYENSAHYPQFEEVDKFSEWMIATFAD